jgi:hypothetical protein
MPGNGLEGDEVPELKPSESISNRDS